MAKLVSADDEERNRLTACEATDMAVLEHPASAVELQHAAHRISIALRK